MIEARPLTKVRLAQHYFDHMTDGVDQHPVAGHLTQILQDFTAPALPPDLGTFAAFLQQRYAELIALLRKSIELNEPLLCSL